MTSNIPTDLETVHDLKCWPQFFEKLVDGTKAFEIRKNDRGYQVGNKLRLREWNPDTGEYTGREVGRVVTYLTAFAQQPGWVVMGVRGGGDTRFDRSLSEALNSGDGSYRP